MSVCKTATRPIQVLLELSLSFWSRGSCESNSCSDSDSQLNSEEFTLGRIAALVCWGILFACTCLLLLHIIRQSVWSTGTRPVDDGSWRRCWKLTQCAAKPKHKEIFVLNNESSVLYKKNLNIEKKSLTLWQSIFLLCWHYRSSIVSFIYFLLLSCKHVGLWALYCPN